MCLRARLDPACMIEGSCVSTVRDQQMMSMIEEERGEMHSLLVNVYVWRRAQSLAYVSGCINSNWSCMMVKTHACGC